MRLAAAKVRDHGPFNQGGNGRLVLFPRGAGRFPDERLQEILLVLTNLRDSRRRPKYRGQEAGDEPTFLAQLPQVWLRP